MHLLSKNPEKENKKTSTEQEIAKLNKTGNQKPHETIIISRQNKRNREKQRKIQRPEKQTKKGKGIGRIGKNNYST